MKTVPTIAPSPTWHSRLAALTLQNGGGSIYVGHSDNPLDKSVFPTDRAKQNKIGRYFVACCETCGQVTACALKESAITGAIRRWYGQLTHDHPGAFVGSWLDGQLLYLDIVLPISNLGDALTLARATNQQAIYDAVKGECLNV